MPRRIFGPKRDEMAERLRKLHNMEFNNTYLLQEGEMESACSTHGREEVCLQDFGRKS
jgi:hypothetical protein